MIRQSSDPNSLPQLVEPPDHIQGSVNAGVLLMEYGDYQCLRCGEAFGTVKAIQQQLGDQLCFVFRHFPLTQHQQAQKAAESAEFAAVQGKFWEMHNTLFEHQQALEDADLVEYALQLNLDVYQFLQAMSEHHHAERVQADIHSGVSSGVTETPTFFINGDRYDGDWQLEPLLAAIETARNTH